MSWDRCDVWDRVKLLPLSSLSVHLLRCWLGKEIPQWDYERRVESRMRWARSLPCLVLSIGYSKRAVKGDEGQGM
jgi:hypothetical protein